MANTWTANGANTPLMGTKNSDGSITLSGAELNAIQAIAVANQVIGGYSAIPATENQVITVGAGQNPWFVDIQGSAPLNQLTFILPSAETGKVARSRSFFFHMAVNNIIWQVAGGGVIGAPSNVEPNAGFVLREMENSQWGCFGV